LAGNRDLADPLVQESRSPAPDCSIEVAVHPDKQVTRADKIGRIEVSGVVRIGRATEDVANPDQGAAFGRVSRKALRLEREPIDDFRNVADAYSGPVRMLPDELASVVLDDLVQ